MKWMIQYQVQGEDNPRTQMLEEESRESAVSLVFNDFFADNPGRKIKLLAAVEVVDAR
jgi:hypothetical protein